MMTFAVSIATRRGFPPKRAHEWITVESGHEFAFAEEDLLRNAERYEAQARQTGFEVPDDEPDTDS